MDKQPTKVALFNAADYHRDFYSAYPTLIVEDHDKDRDFRWSARIESYKPIAWEFNGERRVEPVAEIALGDDREWAGHFPEVKRTPMPGHVPVTQARYLTMGPEDQLRVRILQDQWRLAVAEASARNPKPIYLLHETVGEDDLTKDEADAAAQEWAIEHMRPYEIKRNPNKQSGHALVLNPFGAGPGAMILDVLTRLLGREKVAKAIRRSRSWRDFVSWAVAYNGTIRNNMLTQVLNAMDAGAGAALTRGYDGSRPATGGAATTLLYEITMADPSASVASQVLTFSSMPRTDTSANATGTNTWAREVDSVATFVFDLNCGTSGSDLNYNVVAITTGLQVAIDSWTITEGNP